MAPGEALFPEDIQGIKCFAFLFARGFLNEWDWLNNLSSRDDATACEQRELRLIS
jgi:hypothetical protein